MKKFILLFVMAIVSFTVAEAQQISKILGKANYPSTVYVDLDTDTMKHTTAFASTTFNFAIEYTNGSTPLDAGDIIVCDMYMTTITNGNSFTEGDSVHYRLSQDLAAGETIQIEVTTAIPLNNWWPNAIVTVGDVSTFTLWAKVYYTSKFNVNVQKSLKGIYLKTTPQSSINESFIKNVQLFPNPVNSSLNITNLNNTKVEIYNVVGQRISTYENANGSLNIDMTAYPNGIYFVKMQNGKSVRTEKIKLVK